MKYLIHSGLFCFLLSQSVTVSAQDKVIVSVKDFKPVIGTWKGVLTYLDYSSGKSYTMAADVKINRISGTPQLIFFNSYPKEPGANSKDTLRVAGNKINEEKVISRKKLQNGSLQILTEISGSDGNAGTPAQIRHTYILSASLFIIRKEVLFKGETSWVLRNESTYKR